MEFTTQTKGLETFMVCDIAPEEHIDTMGLGMLKNNRIKGLVQTTHIRIDDKDTLHYNISSQVSLRQFFLGNADKKRFLSVLKNILTTISELQEYMLDPGYLRQEKENIYINVGTMQTEMIYYPVIEEKMQFDVKEYVKKFIIEMEFNEEENGTYITKLINFINKPVEITVEEIKEYVDMLLKDSKEQEYTYVEVPQSAFSMPQFMLQQPMQALTQPEQEMQSVNMPMVQLESNKLETQQSPEIGTSFAVPGMEVVPDMEQTTKTEKKKKGMFSSWFKSEATSNKKKTKKEKNKKTTNNEKDMVIPGMPIPGINETQQEVLPEPPRPTGVSLQNIQQPKIPQPVKTQTVQQQPVYIAMQATAAQPVVQFPQQQPAGYGEAAVLKFNGSGETTVLKPGYNTMQKERMPYLVRKKTNERIDITKDVFRIGKERNYVDYWVYDNSAVSRSHADIIHKDREFYIMDNNSLNHTFVSGTQIESQKLVKLEDFSTITMADEIFEFHL